LLHFLLLGTVVFGIRQLVWPRADTLPDPVVIRADQIDRIRADWMRRAGRAPSPADLEAAISDLVDRELLVREALAAGLQHRDAVVERRLIANQRFVEASTANGEGAAHSKPRSDAELLREAYALGLERTDLVVRRRLIERMRQRILAAARARPAGDKALPRPPAARPETAPRVRLQHVFLSRDLRSERLAQDAAALYAQLVGSGLSPAEAAGRGLGDPLLVPSRLPLSNERELTARLGAEFASLALVLPAGRWSEPIPSSYGLHLVWIEERVWIDERVEPAGHVTDERWNGSGEPDPVAWERAVMDDALEALRRGVVVVREPERTRAGVGDTH